MLFNQQKLIQKIVVVYCKTNGVQTFTQHGLYVKWIHSYFTHTQHVGMSLTGLFDIEYSNALCSGVTEASLFICAFIFSVLQGVASQQNPGGDRVTGQMGKGWVIHHRKNHGH